MTSPDPKAPELPPLDRNDHPDPQGWRWTELEIDFIKKYALRYGAPLLAEIERLKVERDALKLQAQCWSSEAKAQRSTIFDSYQAISGATGEPGDWNGAEPIRKLVAERDELRAQLEAARKDAERYRFMRNNKTFQDRNGPGYYWYLPYFLHREGSHGDRLDSAIDAARAGK